MKFIAFGTKGLIDISIKEINNKLKTDVISSTEKYVLFDYTGDISIFTNLLTVDDVCILIDDIQSNEITNDLIIESLTADKINTAINVLSKIRRVKNTFSITISRFKNDIDLNQIQNSLIGKFKEKFQFEFTEREHENFDVRIIIEGGRFISGVRIFKNSLYKRKYNHEPVLGSIRSTIAASIIFKLANSRTDLKLVDNMCGSGTFLCEGLLQELDIHGGDIDRYNLGIANKNLSKITDQRIILRNHDATKTKWTDGYFDIAISNLPWNKQVKLNQYYKLYPAIISEYKRIIKPQGSLALIAVREDILINSIKKEFPEHNIEVRKIGFQGQNPSIIFVTSN